LLFFLSFTRREEEMRKAILLLAALLVCVPAHAAPKWHWFKDKKLWLSFALIGGSIVADVETTQMARGRGAQEGNPLFGSQPSRLRAYAASIALDAPLLVGLYLSRKRKRNRYWLSFTAIGAGPHIGAALWNSRVCQPSCK
jgi:hypothetical protein